MAQSVRARAMHLPHIPHVTLNTDGRAHPRENTLLAVSVALAIVAIVAAPMRAQHMLASWTGLAGLVTGLYAQLISKTTAERCVIVVAIVTSGVALAVGLNHGGLY